MMHHNRFWLLLRLRWIVFVLLYALLFSVGLSAIITLVVFVFSQTQLNEQTFEALMTIASFWFNVSFSLAFAVAILFAFKRLFYYSIGGYELVLLDHERKERLEPLFVTDMFILWRKFIFWVAWIVAFLALVLLVGFKVDVSYFGGYNLFGLVLFIGLVVLKPLLATTVRVKIIKGHR